MTNHSLLRFVTLCIFLRLLHSPEQRGPALFIHLPGAPDRQGIGRHILGDDAAGRHNRAIADADGATSTALLPINASAPIVVRYLPIPS